jgi:lysozyme
MNKKKSGSFTGRVLGVGMVLTSLFTVPYIAKFAKDNLSESGKNYISGRVDISDANDSIGGINLEEFQIRIGAANTAVEDYVVQDSVQVEESYVEREVDVVVDELEKIVSQEESLEVVGEKIVSYREPTDISKAGIELIKGHENFEPKPYPDFGQMSIGYGHGIKSYENLKEITEKEAEKLLERDLDSFEEDVSDLVKVSLTQNQYDALVSFTYNLGPTNLGKSTLLRKLNKGDYAGAANEFKRWNKAGGKVRSGLVERRQDEYEMFVGVKNE